MSGALCPFGSLDEFIHTGTDESLHRQEHVDEPGRDRVPGAGGTIGDGCAVSWLRYQQNLTRFSAGGGERGLSFDTVCDRNNAGAEFRQCLLGRLDAFDVQ
ncbi:hypothetical protein [Rhodococcus sp. HS-D2]|uniref:hypothetical protein n=1 Tax=Rhodococcus sp. HS-D2 TaxID=1384636 RepID=UPI0018D2D9FF|nr:hypothetical protein [Rhodococcus sp. HS-D2]